MDIIVVEDAAPHRDHYLGVVGRALSAAWREAGHAVTRIGPPDRETKVHADVSDAAMRRILEHHPDARVHLLTNGPLAQAMAGACARDARPFTSTQAAAHVPLHERAAFAARVDTIHGAALRVIAAAPAAARLLTAAGIDSALVVTAGVDPETFQPRVYRYLDVPRPLTLLLGASPEAELIGEFMAVPLPGTRMIYAPGRTGGSAPADGVRLVGYLPPDELAHLISAADVCVVPDDGPDAILLALQSLACGVPVAARRSDYLEQLLPSEAAGVVDDNLGRAVTRALAGNRQVCRGLARPHSWTRAARAILAAGEPADGVAAARAA